MQKKYYAIIFLIILSVCLVVPFSIDIFISGFPAMSRYFPGANVSLILSVALLGLAVAQPIYGPLLDRFGRRPVLMVGLWIYTIASAQVMLTNSFTLLLIGRVIQALGACSAIISVFAIARDSYHEEKLIKATSLIMAMIGVSPAIAPLIGSLLNTLWGWRSSFIFLFIIGVFYALLVQIFFKETLLNKNHKALVFKNIFSNYLLLAKTPGFLMYCLTSGFSYSVLFSYLSLSSLFIIEQLHFNLINYGIIVAINALAIVVVAIFAPQLAKILSLSFTIKLGLSIIFFGGFLMWGVNLYFPTNIYTFMLPMFITTIGIGLIRPTASASALQLSPRQIAGSASAFFSFVSFIAGSIATTISAKLIYHVSSFGLFIMIMAISALLVMSIKLIKPVIELKSKQIEE